MHRSEYDRITKTTDISLLKELFNRLLCILSLTRLLERIRRRASLETLELERIPCREEVCAVDSLEEWLDFVPLCNRLFAHALGHFSWVSLNASDNGVWVRSILGSLVELFDYDNLSSGLSALEDNGDLSWLVDLDQIGRAHV